VEAQGAFLMHADNRRGILAMSLAMALFIANDALVKQVSATLPGPQLIFLRGLMATTLVLIMAQANKKENKRRLCEELNTLAKQPRENIN